jgi:hypothetical protein
MNKKLVSLTFLFVTICYLQLVLVASAPPVTQVQQFTEGYIIEGSPTEYLKENTSLTYNFFLYNISNGVQIIDGVSCGFYIASGNGSLLYSGIPTYTSGYYSLFIDGGNFTRLGHYPYGVYCNSSKLGGSTVSYFEVNHSGMDLSGSQVTIYIILLSILVFFFFINIYGIRQLPAYNNRDEDGNLLSINHLKYLRSVLWVFAYGILLIILYIAGGLSLNYLYTNTGDIFFTLFRILYMMVYPGIILWFIYLFVKVTQDKELKRMLERGLIENNTI